MSEAIGETFVTITPIVDEASFKASAQQQINAATTGVKADVGVDATGMFRELQKAQAEVADAFGKAQLAGAKSLVGKGTVADETAALHAYTQAALRAAKADVDLFIAHGVQSETYAASAALLKQEQLALLQNTAATEQNTLSTRENRQAHSQTFRGQLRNVTEGRADAGSLLSPAALLRFAGAGLAIGAVFQGLQRAQEALKVTGDEAFTTEGKLRNFAAALTTGDIVGGLVGLAAHAKSATEQVEDLVEELKLVPPPEPAAKLEELTEKFSEQKKAVDEHLESLATSSDTQSKWQAQIEASSHQLKNQSTELGVATQAAQRYADQVLEAAEAAKTLATQAATAERNQLLAARTASLTDNLAEARRVEREARENVADNPRFGGGPRRGELIPSPELREDEIAVVKARNEVLRLRAQIAAEEKRLAADGAAATSAVNESVSGRTTGLTDDLAEARRQETAARKKWADAAVKDKQEAYKDVVVAHSKVVKINQDIAAANKAAAKEAASEAAEDLRSRLALREGRLQIALEDARATAGDLADDRKALLALIAFEKEKQNNRKLTLQERQDALAAERAYRRDLNELNKQLLADALGVRRQNLENAILAAKLTDDGDKDDDRANAKKLKFLQNEVKRAKGDALAVAQAKNELLAFQLSLKDDASGSGFTIEDLFGEAQKQFQEFGSNVSSGVSTGGSVRGAFAGGIVAQNPKVTPGEQQQLSVAGETNLLLGRILEALTRGQLRPAATKAAAAAWEGGGPPGLERAWTTKQLTGKTG